MSHEDLAAAPAGGPTSGGAQGQQGTPADQAVQEYLQSYAGQGVGRRMQDLANQLAIQAFRLEQALKDRGIDEGEANQTARGVAVNAVSRAMQRPPVVANVKI